MSETVVRHTCTRDGKALPFGRKAPEGECPRCDELRAGAAPRSAPAWVEGVRRRRADAVRRAHEIRTHDCRQANCGTVCTAFDW